MAERLSDGSEFVLTGEELAELERILEFGIVAYLAWLISESTLDSLLRASFPLGQAVLAKWRSFFGSLLIYYRLIRVKLNIDR